MSDNNNYTDNTFNLYQAYSYTLLLQLNKTTFSYAVVHQNRLLLSAQNCDLQELVYPRQLSELLTATYKNVITGMPATALTLVPKSLFREDRVANIARFLDVNEDERVFAHPLNGQNMVVYKTDAKLVSAVQKFGLQNTVYNAEGWINAIEKNSPPDDYVFLDIQGDTAQFLYFSTDSLRFYNTFAFSSADDLVYFATLVTDELKLKPQYISLIVSGDIAEGDENMQRLAAFYPKVELNSLKVLELPGQIAAHKILALAGLSLCGSSEAR